MPVIEFRTLGTLDLRGADGRELHSLLAQPKRIALLAYLCIAQPRGFHHRDTLLGLFWPSADQDHARASLRKALHILRRALGDDAILSRGDEEVAVDFQHVSCDAAVFEESLKANRLEEALELYRGDLLTGFFIDDAPEFEQWLHSERTRLRASAARAAYAMSERLEASGNFGAAVSWARRSLELSDTDERALRKLIELQCRAGDRTGAIQAYETFARHLAAEYETEPSSETRSLIERIRSGKEWPGRESEVKAAAARERNGERSAAPPPHVADAVSPALGKVSQDQFGSADDFAENLNNPSVTVSAAAGAVKGKGGIRRESRMLYAVIALAILISGTAIWGRMRPAPSKQVVRYTLAIDSTEAMAPGTPWSGRLAISPDGSRLAYIGGPHWQLLIRPLNQLHATAVPGTDSASTPFFSPDGSQVGLLREKTIQIASLNGGSPITVSDSLTGVAGASWGRDGYIYADGFEFKPLVRVEAKSGAVPKWFTVLDTARGEFDHTWPDVLPNGKGVLFTVSFSGKNGVKGSLSYAIAIADIPSGKHRVIVDDAMYARYATSGHLLYVTTNRTLMVRPFDQNSMKFTGQPTARIEGMRLGDYGSADLAVSAMGTLVYATGPEQGSKELVWVTRDGKAQSVDPDWQGRNLRDPTLSPDGKRLAVETIIKNDETSEILIKQLDRGPRIKLTLEGKQNYYPTWTPDGRSVTFSSRSTVAGPSDLWTKRADGSAQAVLQFHEKRASLRPRWSPDGKWLIFQTSVGAPDSGDILGIRPGIDTVAVPLVATKFTEVSPALSPDGRWLAYTSNESGQFEIYVVPFPNTSSAKSAVSTRGGTEPLWSHRGSELFYRDGSGYLVAVEVKTTPAFSLGRSTRLFPAAEFASLEVSPQYAVSSDDRRFLMIRPLATGMPDKLFLVENWFEELKERK
jgi:DNA-binding SARP family transcriptional activator/Tol biopolymer transport system component